ncbi:MAG: 3-isopropylmalate dehydratase large subunit [Thermovirgaceae bacterium]
MHAIEKILARASGRKKVTAGEIVIAEVDVAEVNDLYLQVVKSFYELGGTEVANPEKTTFVFDHYSPAPTIKAACNHKSMREFCSKRGIRHLFDIGDGVCHQVLVESGMVGPGKIVVETDSHTTTMGALGAFGTGVGATDMAVILITGKLWFKVPSVMKVVLKGDLNDSVMAKDLILHVIGDLKQDAAIYKAVEFAGEAVRKMPQEERMVLCNMAVEMGAKTAYIAPDDITYEYLARYGWEKGDVPVTDEDYEYESIVTYDVSKITPCVALPGSVDNVSPIPGEKIRIDQVFLGTCTGGRLNDIRVAAEILKGKKVAPGTRFVVIPASRLVFQDAMKAGYIETLVDAGAVLSTPGCGPCLGAHEGVLAPDEKCVSTSSRNFPGRMGSTEAQVYIASPATAAVTALKGHLCGADSL